MADGNSRAAAAGPARPAYTYAELVDVNDRGQAAGMSGTFTETGFPEAKPAIWRTGWDGLRDPAASRPRLGLTASSSHSSTTSTPAERSSATSSACRPRTSASSARLPGAVDVPVRSLTSYAAQEGQGDVP